MPCVMEMKVFIVIAAIATFSTLQQTNERAYSSFSFAELAIIEKMMSVM